VRRIASLRSLRHLDLGRASASAGALRALGALVRLESVSLAETAADDGVLAALAPLQALSTLDLDHTRVTAAGLAHLGRLPKLDALSLCGTPVSGPDLAHLGALRTLRRLDLELTGATDAVLVSLARLPRLAWLSLRDTPVQLAGGRLQLPALRHLDLGGTDLGPGARQALAGLASGCALRLDGTVLQGARAQDLVGR